MHSANRNSGVWYRSDASAAMHSPETSEVVATISLRILVVDDNQDAANSLSALLQVLGHEVRTAYDGAGGAEAAREFDPDVVLLDIALPKLNGYEVARRIRATHRGKGAVLIALTGFGQASDKQRALDAGFDHYLVKPVEPEALLRLLGSLRYESGDRPARNPSI
jgi:DNA-binding response OmpR family regulator